MMWKVSYVHHRLLWEKCILEEVSAEDSIWYELYVGECFRSLLWPKKLGTVMRMYD